VAALWIWLGLAAVCIVIEVLSVQLFFLMVAVGAVAAGIAAALGADTVLQILIAAVISALGIFLVRPVAMRHLQSKNSATATNVDALLGQPVRVTAQVTETTGTAVISGETWSARIEPGQSPIPPGMPAQVQRIDGAYLILQAGVAPTDNQ